MELGFVGLGRMGMNMVRRLQRDKHRVITYDRSPDVVKASVQEGAEGTTSLRDLVGKLTPPRAVWVMVPAGAPTEGTIRELSGLLQPDDVIVDGGNSHYKDDARRAAELRAKAIHYLDAGTSGGIWGLQIGYCLMIGGDEVIFKRLEPIFKTLAPEDGYAYMGSAGAGHYVKMIHNGIEYGLMQAYAEGFELMHASDYRLDVAAVASLWMHGSVVRSWLLELGARALAENPQLAGIEGYVEDSGEGRWTLHEGIDHAVALPVLTAALFT